MNIYKQHARTISQSLWSRSEIGYELMMMMMNEFTLTWRKSMTAMNVLSPADCSRQMQQPPGRLGRRW